MEKNVRLQITKFSLYGLLKNLRFFEPFMLVYFLSSGLNLFQVGLLFSIREIIIYIFEIPSGVIADRYGKKTELIICFLFYIASFILFFFAYNFLLFASAMGLFALGEAFRSGTHKAMIMSYMDKHDIKSSKTKIYGLTRSYSLIGSMIASLVSIVLVLWLPDIKYLFLAAIIPYVIDLLMVLTYPNELNERRDATFDMKSFLKNNYLSIIYVFKHKKVRNAVFNSSSYQAFFKAIKDYIQPILLTFTATYLIFNNFNESEHQKIYIGIMYAFIYLVSAFSSRQAHQLQKLGSERKIVSWMWLLTGIGLFIISFTLSSIFVVSAMFLIFYVIMNLRKPIMVDIIGEVTDDDKRATVLSVEAQTASLMIAIAAPIIGYIAEISMSSLFIGLSILMFLIFIGSIMRKGEKNERISI